MKRSCQTVAKCYGRTSILGTGRVCMTGLVRCSNGPLEMNK
jgi:hypothetical protein